MDIDYLLWLQGLRESLPPIAETLGVLISDIFGAGIITFVIPLLVYWLVSRDKGLVTMLSFGIGTITGQLLKAILCIPRPWVLDSRVHPAERALEKATGYSFPSGHTQAATSMYGTLAWVERHERPLASVCLVLLALLVALSRNFVGVHTPQDVVAGIALGIAGIAIAIPLAAKLKEAGPAGQLISVLVALLAVAGVLAYVTFKDYPVSDVSGIPMSDGYKMQVDCYKSAGFLTGLAMGWLVERIFVNGFDAPTTLGEGGMRAAVGLIVTASAYLLLKRLAMPIMGELWAEFTRAAVAILLAVGIVPCTFSALRRRLGTVGAHATSKGA